MLVAPVPPKPIPKGMFTAGFLARLAMEKCALGRPLERIVTALRNDGFDFAKGTLVGACKALPELLSPLDAAIRERNSSAAHLHIDETSWKVFEAVADKVGNRWSLWTFIGPDTVVFLGDPTRSTQVVAEHLGINIDAGSLEQGRQLLISSDFYSIYQSLGALEGLDPLWCWAHIWRYEPRQQCASRAAELDGFVARSHRVALCSASCTPSSGGGNHRARFGRGGLCQPPWPKHNDA